MIKQEAHEPYMCNSSMQLCLNTFNKYIWLQRHKNIFISNQFYVNITINYHKQFYWYSHFCIIGWENWFNQQIILSIIKLGWGWPFIWTSLKTLPKKILQAKFKFKWHSDVKLNNNGDGWIDARQILIRKALIWAFS